MKKFVLLSAVASLGLLGLSANAGVPSGYESVKVSATLLEQNGDKVTKVKVTTDDILSIIDNEFGTSYSKQDGGKGYQLVSYGVGYYNDTNNDDIFAVLDKDGNSVLDNASFDSDNYYLYLTPSESGDFVATINGDNYNYTANGVTLTYNSYDDEDSFSFTGAMTDKVNWDSYSENYSLKNGQGYLYFDDEGFNGVLTGASVSGSGKDVYPFNYYY